jgi:hypothetical protein
VGVKIELGSERDVPTFDPFRRAHIEHLQPFPAVESLGQLLWRYLRQGFGHGP